MKKGITHVGMDAHKVAIKLAVVLPEQTKPVEWQLANEKVAVRRMVRRSSGWRRARCAIATRVLRLRAAAMDPGGWSWNGTKRAWSQAHRLWLRSLRLEHEPDQLVLEDYLLAIEQLEQRLPWLEQRIEQLSQQPAYQQALAALRCRGGITKAGNRHVRRS